ncbi:MAG: hypothetical protein F6K03_01630 [Kamptonema sp. SIO4C4]|nr:hypothetical protein [Kamptonema sp. SIO4C4]
MASTLEQVQEEAFIGHACQYLRGFILEEEDDGGDDDAEGAIFSEIPYAYECHPIQDEHVGWRVVNTVETGQFLSSEQSRAGFPLR